MKSPFLSVSFLTIASLKTLPRSVMGIALATGLMAIGLPTQSALSAQVTPQAKPVNTTAKPSTLADGVYLYGQSAEPDQIGRAYFVFEVRQSKVLGALYMPRSSFDCAYGSFQADQLALTVVDSYDRSENPYAIALAKEASVATRGNPAMTQINLEGFEPLAKLSDNDQRVLNVCKQNYQQRAWK
ncbi:MAG: hypothetical protein H7126_00035 [Candidatus Parcubacteria bacterium]|uniref:hypothetical protein n=1 Tax=Phormidesmis priestleyi TaxID=268141 RepID=UPI0009ECE492|nr:hypothetical protein [Phormidesmis priestleyi]MBC7822267.1 hypothetical protein [Leptolyngbyaceae cyanobacterium LF-bin-113]